MKSEPARRRVSNRAWTIDESKCLSMGETTILRRVCDRLRKAGLRSGRFSQVRDWFMIELGLNAGLRVAEMASLRHGDLLIDGEKLSILVLGKGNKRRSIWIGDVFKSICQRYFNCKTRFGYTTGKTAPLLNNLCGDSITKRSLQKAFKSVLELARLPSHYSIHCLRHTYATFLLRASGYNYRFVQRQLGHASIRTTQIYASIVESDGRQALEKLYK
ncbi:MAG: tyrosine-type recombinase/integrase [Proteobacteria bacterium]|nr:tyrosine-type recombinase/integrase [Pseudomonadota bacterium]